MKILNEGEMKEVSGGEQAAEAFWTFLRWAGVVAAVGSFIDGFADGWNSCTCEQPVALCG